MHRVFSCHFRKPCVFSLPAQNILSSSRAQGYGIFSKFPQAIFSPSTKITEQNKKNLSSVIKKSGPAGLEKEKNQLL